MTQGCQWGVSFRRVVWTRDTGALVNPLVLRASRTHQAPRTSRVGEWVRVLVFNCQVWVPNLSFVFDQAMPWGKWLTVPDSVSLLAKRGD